MRGADPSTAWGKLRSGEETVEGIIAIDIDIATKRVDSRSCQTNLLKSLGKHRETGIANQTGRSARDGARNCLQALKDSSEPCQNYPVWILWEAQETKNLPD